MPTLQSQIDSAVSGDVIDFPVGVFSERVSISASKPNLTIRGAEMTSPTRAVTSITSANPAVVTSNAHGLSDGDPIYLRNVIGLLDIFGVTLVNGRRFIVRNSTTNTYELEMLNGDPLDASTAVTGYTSGGIVSLATIMGGVDTWADLTKIHGLSATETIVGFYFHQRNGLADVTGYPEGCQLMQCSAERVNYGTINRCRNFICEDFKISNQASIGGPGGDADGFRWAGTNMVCRRMTVYQAIEGAGGIDPTTHADGIQTFNNNGEVVSGALFESCQVYIQDQGATVEDNNTTVGKIVENLTWDGCLFIGPGSSETTHGIDVRSVLNVKIINTTFNGVSTPVYFKAGSASTGCVYNNTYIDWNTDHDPVYFAAEAPSTNISLVPPASNVRLYPASPMASIEASGTYIASNTTDSVWSTGLTGTGTTSTNLNVLTRYPLDSDPRAPRPCIISLPGGGFSLMNPSSGDTNGLNLVSRGFVLMSPKYRTEADSPFSAFNQSGDSDKKKAMRCALEDVHRFVSWALLNRITANYNIDPRGIFLLGSSAGAQLAMMYCIKYSAHQIAGLINVRGGFGLDDLGAWAGPSDTADLRSLYTETDWVNSNPKVLALLGGSDTVIGDTPDNWNEDLKTRLELDGANTVYYDAAEAHTNIDATPSIYGRSDPYGDVATFCDSIWSPLAERTTPLTLA